MVEGEKVGSSGKDNTGQAPGQMFYSLPNRLSPSSPDSKVEIDQHIAVNIIIRALTNEQLSILLTYVNFSVLSPLTMTHFSVLSLPHPNYLLGLLFSLPTHRNTL